ncbi:AAA family ATPase [Lactococcus petauri]|uniref:AAA family ATPase n=3 Tax=Lactococcus TaxID=1357 RepID=A0A9X4NYI8_9LACT|nr:MULTISPECIES: AAA family ATPase [Lactococcus]YP_009279668.1 Sak4-like ssDNA annealing protein [Lactococcus phage PLgT-1]ANA49667.1 DNA-binding protein [Lactococcus phage PLgT-1]EOT33279.1 phage nucleotide-binding protein [Lactococcus garvieae ATCC 49156]EOT93318.1 phage nucleotide-binding protein [Lactococcus garvieae ATCC 49156]MDC0810241.1 AAA family ATPase [Lactococcus petauri]MDG6145922.1 AAA family ATPase [Lactococcus formosensis]
MALEIKKATEISRTHEWRVLLYGKPGLGKTSAIKGLTGKVLVLDLDGSSRVLAGLKDVDVISFNRENPIQSMKEFLDEARGILKGYQTLVIDNITAFEKDWFVARGLKSKNGIRNEIQDYGDYTNYFLRLITMIYSLPINIYVTAWEDKRDIDLEDGTKLTEYIPQVRNQVLNQLLGLTDVVGRIQVNPATHGRGAILEGSDGVYAKNRLDDRTACKIEDLFKFGQIVEKNKENGEQK